MTVLTLSAKLPVSWDQVGNSSQTTPFLKPVVYQRIHFGGYNLLENKQQNR